VNLRNEKIEIDKFFNLRDDILSKWNTGNKVDLDEVLDYYSNYPEEKFVIKEKPKL